MDIRERTAHPQGWTEDWQEMKLLDSNNEKSYPAKAEVCHCCNGKGTCVNPSIDCHGISMNEFDEDPEFKENYFRGHYDIICPHCNGKNVILVPTTSEGKENYANQLQEEYNYQAEIEAERRFGC